MHIHILRNGSKFLVLHGSIIRNWTFKKSFSLPNLANGQLCTPPHARHAFCFQAYKLVLRLAKKPCDYEFWTASVACGYSNHICTRALLVVSMWMLFSQGRPSTRVRLGYIRVVLTNHWHMRLGTLSAINQPDASLERKMLHFSALTVRYSKLSGVNTTQFEKKMSKCNNRRGLKTPIFH